MYDGILPNAIFGNIINRPKHGFFNILYNQYIINEK